MIVDIHLSIRIKSSQSKQNDIDLYDIIKREGNQEENNFKTIRKRIQGNAVHYLCDHPELTIKECTEKLGMPYDTYHG